LKHELKQFFRPEDPNSAVYWDMTKLPEIQAGYVVYVYKRNARRTLPQNSLYWKWLNAIEEHSDGQYEAEKIHEAFKRMFNPAEVLMNKIPMTVGGSTAEMKKKEFSDYLERIQRYVIQDMGYPEYLVRWPKEMSMDELTEAQHIGER